ncbi:MAG: hypothetical protein ACXACI_07460 [Candidatus Hodarchaeales archaeon]|jgi:hypothetical protein
MPKTKDISTVVIRIRESDKQLLDKVQLQLQNRESNPHLYPHDAFHHLLKVYAKKVDPAWIQLGEDDPGTEFKCLKPLKESNDSKET